MSAKSWGVFQETLAHYQAHYIACHVWYDGCLYTLTVTADQWDESMVTDGFPVYRITSTAWLPVDDDCVLMPDVSSMRLNPTASDVTLTMFCFLTKADVSLGTCMRQALLAGMSAWGEMWGALQCQPLMRFQVVRQHGMMEDACPPHHRAHDWTGPSYALRQEWMKVLQAADWPVMSHYFDEKSTESCLQLAPMPLWKGVDSLVLGAGLLGHVADAFAFSATLSSLFEMTWSWSSHQPTDQALAHMAAGLCYGFSLYQASFGSSDVVCSVKVLSGHGLVITCSHVRDPYQVWYAMAWSAYIGLNQGLAWEVCDDGKTFSVTRASLSSVDLMQFKQAWVSLSPLKLPQALASM